MADAQSIPAFVNPKSGTAEGARKALASGPFDVHEVQPENLESQISAEVKKKPKRILIAGGDGTIRARLEAAGAIGQQERDIVAGATGNGKIETAGAAEVAGNNGARLGLDCYRTLG